MSGKYDQESQVELLFKEIKAGFSKLEDQPNAAKQQAALRDLTAKMQEVKALVKEFEREARMEGMPVADLAKRKKDLVQELNGYIAHKKALSEAAESHAALVGGAKGKNQPKGQDTMSTDQLIQLGRKEIQSTDQALIRAQKVVADTIDVGTKTAETLEGQTKQLERVMDDLDEIHFTLKKASAVIRDITRGLATDNCIRFMLMAVILGALVLIALRIAGVGALRKSIPTPSFVTNLDTSVGRRLLTAPSASRGG